MKKLSRVVLSLSLSSPSTLYINDAPTGPDKGNSLNWHLFKWLVSFHLPYTPLLGSYKIQEVRDWNQSCEFMYACAGKTEYLWLTMFPHASTSMLASTRTHSWLSVPQPASTAFLRSFRQSSPGHDSVASASAIKKMPIERIFLARASQCIFGI